MYTQENPRKSPVEQYAKGRRKIRKQTNVKLVKQKSLQESDRKKTSNNE